MTLSREDWLLALLGRIRPLAAKAGHPLPERLRVTCGWPSKGGIGRKVRRLGECWHPDASADHSVEVFVSPTESEGRKVAAILGHELAHAAAGHAAGHGKEWKRVARAFGVTPKARGCDGTLGDDLLAAYSETVATAGPYPHAAITPKGKASDGPKKQASRWFPVRCHVCGYQARTTRKWLDAVGPPVCPKDEVAMDREERLGKAEPEGDDE